MSTSRPTIYDVARAAGVSKSLVSLVLRGAPGVSERSRIAVRAAMEDLGFRANHAATTLSARRTFTVGLLIDDYTNDWFVDLVRGLEPELAIEGYRLSIVEAAMTSERRDPVDGLLSARPDGIVVAMDVPDALLAPDAPPVVVAGTREHVPPTVDSVANDDWVGARLATEHLLALRHHRIAHLPAAGGAGVARDEGYVATMRHAGLQTLRGPVVPPAATESMGYLAAAAVLDAHQDITAIFAANDAMATGALGAARERGLDVPGQLSVIGYDDTPLARMKLVDLTTIDDMSVRVGHEAAKLLIARMLNGRASPVHTTVQPELVIRSTTAAPAHA